MKSYPSISNKIVDIDIYAFDKLDGSNIRAEWTRKSKSFVKFGSRNRLLGEDQGDLYLSKELISDLYQTELSRRFVDMRVDKVTVFFEVYGADSFAGNHFAGIDSATLIEVIVYKKGIIPPKEFIEFSEGLDTPKVLYHGKPNSEFLSSVMNNTLDGMTFEGVVCKSQRKITDRPVMFKVKTLDWKNKLKTFCAGDDNMYNKLV